MMLVGGIKRSEIAIKVNAIHRQNHPWWCMPAQTSLTSRSQLKKLCFFSLRERCSPFADQMQNTSLCFALRARQSLSKFVPDEFVEKQVSNAQQRVNNLTQSVLAKALYSHIPVLGASPQPAAAPIRSCRIGRGELTADWRAQNPDLISGENSAEALLQKIKLEREKLKPAKKTRKKKA